MTTTRDDNEIFARRLLAARRRALKHLVRALERQAQQLAIRARRDGERTRRHAQPAPVNPVAQMKREVMPLIAQLAELAAGGEPPPQRAEGPRPAPPTPKGRGPRRRMTHERACHRAGQGPGSVRRDPVGSGAPAGDARGEGRSGRSRGAGAAAQSERIGADET
jgi:hypothetical protein